MRAQLEAFFKQRRGLAFGIILVLTFFLVFVMPKIFSSFEPSAQKSFWACFLVSFPFSMFLLFRKPKI